MAQFNHEDIMDRLAALDESIAARDAETKIALEEHDESLAGALMEQNELLALQLMELNRLANIVDLHMRKNPQEFGNG